MAKNILGCMLLWLLVILIAFQFSAWGVGEGSYDTIRKIIILNIVVLFLVTLKNPTVMLSRVPVLRVHFFCLLVFSVSLFLVLVMGYGDKTAPLRDLCLALGLAVIGYNLCLSEGQVRIVCMLFVVCFFFSALSIVYTYADGFIIHDRYLPIPKNQFAPVYGFAFLLALYLGFRSLPLYKLVFFTIAAVLFCVMLVIRGRAAILALFIATLIFFVFYLQNKRQRLFGLLMMLSPVPFVGGLIYDSLFLNYDVSDINSVSTGRFDVYIYGLNLLVNNPLFGALTIEYEADSIIHNYLLYNLVNYGIVFVAPLVFVYFKYVLVIINAIRNNNFLYSEAGPLLMLFLFIISLFEYTLPYAPGTTVAISFVLFGVYLRSCKG